jgi:hypothetical protein
MKRTILSLNLHAIPLALALTMPAVGPARAQTWQTVLDFQFAAGESADCEGIVADTLGNVFAAGNGADTLGTNHGLALKTDTTEATWYLSDDTNPNASQYQSAVWNLGVDAGGHVYSIGQLTPASTGVANWYVRKSSDAGLTWSTVDLYQYAAGKWVDATGFAADSSGGVYVAGWGRDATRLSNIHWLVRKSTDGGQTWTLVDDVTGPTADGAGFVPGAGVFVTGGRFDGLSSWLVRRSVTGQSGTWTTVDGPFAYGAARGACGDSLGNVYVAGSMFITNQPATKHSAATGYYAWTTRKSSDGGSTWSTVDTFSYAPNEQSDAEAIAADPSGNVVVVGKASDAQGQGHWIVRRLGSSGWQTIDDFPGGIATSVTSDAAGHLLVAGPASSHWIVRRL